MRRLIQRLWKVKHEEFDDVLLTRTTIVGDMQSGKTTTIETIIKAINEVYSDIPQVNIYTRSYREVHSLHRKQHEDIREAIEKAEILNILIDDALTTMHVRGHYVSDEINFAMIRHYFKEKLDIRRMTLNVFFATQRYQLLFNMMRQAPILLFKAITVRDYWERRQIAGLLGWNYLKYLDEMAREVLINKNREYMDKTIFCEGKRVKVVDFPKDNEGISFYDLEGDNLSERDRYVLNALRDGWTYREIESVFEISSRDIARLSRYYKYKLKVESKTG